MEQSRQAVALRTASGPPVTAHGVTLTPQSQALTVRWANGGVVWNRPLAVLVDRGGQTERIPVVDVTRLLQVVLFGLSAAFAVATLALAGQKRKERRNG